MTVDLKNGLVSYWKFDETSGTTFADSHGSNNGTASNSRVLNTDGKINKCADFTKGNDYVSSNVQFFNSNKFSLNFWLYDSSTTNAIRRWIATTNDGFLSNTFAIRENNGNIQLYIGSLNFTITQHEKAKWIMYSITSDGTNVKLYKNGQQILSEASTTVISQSGLYIGGYYLSGEFFNGLIDEPAIWSRALSEDEISHLYLSQVIGEADGQYPDFKVDMSEVLKQNLHIYWKFDENTGTTAVDSIGNQNGTLSTTGLWTSTNQKLGDAGLDFTNNINQSVAVGTTSTYNFIHEGTSNFSFGFWIYRQGSALSGRVFDNTIGGDRRGFTVAVDNRNVYFGISKQGAGWPIVSKTFTDVLPDTIGWHFVVFTFNISDGTNQGKLYINGAYVDAVTRSTAFEAGNSNNNPILGRYAASDAARLNTYLDEVFFYKKVLNADEIEALYNEGAGWQYPFVSLFKGIKIKLLSLFTDKPLKIKQSGTFEEKPMKVKVGGVFI